MLVLGAWRCLTLVLALQLCAQLAETSRGNHGPRRSADGTAQEQQLLWLDAVGGVFGVYLDALRHLASKTTAALAADHAADHAAGCSHDHEEGRARPSPGYAYVEDDGSLTMAARPRCATTARAGQGPPPGQGAPAAPAGAGNETAAHALPSTHGQNQSAASLDDGDTFGPGLGVGPRAEAGLGNGTLDHRPRAEPVSGGVRVNGSVLAYAFLPLPLRATAASNSSSLPLKNATHRLLLQLAAVGATFRSNRLRLAAGGVGAAWASSTVMRVVTRNGLALLHPAPTTPARDTYQQYQPLRDVWYASTCSGYRDVVVVLDASGTMAGEPLLFAKHLARSIIDTLSQYDSVAVLAYSSQYERGVKILGGAPQSRLATAAWQAALIDAVFAVGAKGRGSLDAGLEEGLLLLSRQRASSPAPLGMGSRTRLVFVASDGSDAASGSAVYARAQAAATGAGVELGGDAGGVRVFTYQVGYTVWIDAQGLQSLARVSGGAFLAVRHPQQIAAAATGYFNDALGCFGTAGNGSSPHYTRTGAVLGSERQGSTDASGALLWDPPRFTFGHGPNQTTTTTTSSWGALTLSQPVFSGDGPCTFAGAVAVEMPVGVLQDACSAGGAGGVGAGGVGARAFIVGPHGDVVAHSRGGGNGTLAAASTVELAAPGLSPPQYKALRGHGEGQGSFAADGHIYWHARIRSTPFVLVTARSPRRA